VFIVRLGCVRVVLGLLSVVRKEALLDVRHRLWLRALSYW